LLCHGSPRKMNEFLWETTTSDAFLNWLLEKYDTDIIVGTHTGLRWHRETSPGKHFINCGAIGRPPNDGRTTVVYTIINAENADNGGWFADFAADLSSDSSSEALAKEEALAKSEACGVSDDRANSEKGKNACQLKVDFVRLGYDFERLAFEMASEGLPEEFIETIRTGWWTTCNEVLPAKERARGLY